MKHTLIDKQQLTTMFAKYIPELHITDESLKYTDPLGMILDVISYDMYISDKGAQGLVFTAKTLNCWTAFTHIIKQNTVTSGLFAVYSEPVGIEAKHIEFLDSVAFNITCADGSKHTTLLTTHRLAGEFVDLWNIVSAHVTRNGTCQMYFKEEQAYFHTDTGETVTLKELDSDGSVAWIVDTLGKKHKIAGNFGSNPKVVFDLDRQGTTNAEL